MKVWYVLFISLIPQFLSAQNNLGPRLTAIGKNAVAVSDVWSIQANPAAGQDLRSAIIAISYLKHFFSNEISSQAFAAVLPFNNNLIATSFQVYGFSEYKESTIGFGYAKKFGPDFSVGLNANYHQLKIAGYGHVTGFSLDVGVCYKLLKEVAVGASIINIAQQQYTNEALKSNIPTVFSVGSSYQPTEKVLVAATISKILKQSVDASIGIDYKFARAFSLRGGISISPFKQYGGFGLNYKQFLLDMATVYDPNLGYSPQMGISYAF